MSEDMPLPYTLQIFRIDLEENTKLEFLLQTQSPTIPEAGQFLLIAIPLGKIATTEVIGTRRYDIVAVYQPNPIEASLYVSESGPLMEI